MFYYDEQIEKTRATRDTIKKEDDDEKSHFKKAETRLQCAKLIRLRQATSHAFNLEKMLRTNMTPKNTQRIKRFLNLSSSKTSILDQMLSHEKGRSSFEAYAAGLKLLRDRKEPVFGGIFDWNGMLDLIENEQKVRHVTCSGCKFQTPPIRPVLLAEVSVPG